MKSAFEQYVTTIGTNGTMSFPVLDASNGGLPLLVVGPGYARNGVRFFVRMPTREEASQYPAPMNVDRKSVRFEAVMLYLSAPMPLHYTVEFTRVISGTERGRMKKHPAHLWCPDNDSAIYPANKITIPTMKCEDMIEFEGTSYWFNAKERESRRERRNPLYWPPPPEPPPPVRTVQTISLMLLVKMHWIPMSSVAMRKNVRVVEGSPIDWVSSGTPPEPIPAERVIEPSAQPDPGSHSTNAESSPSAPADSEQQSWAASSPKPKKKL